MPVDPGEHRLSAVAPGRLAWSGSASIEPDGESRVVVPALLPAPVARESAAKAQGSNGTPPAGAPVRDAPPSGGGLRSAATITLATLGLAAIGAGTVFAVNAAHQKNASGCTSTCPSSDGQSLLRDANNAAWAANIAFGASVASLGAAAYLFFSRPSSSSPRSTRVAAVPDMRSLLLVAEGTW
jgi:hypothetical protein